MAWERRPRLQMKVLVEMEEAQPKNLKPLSPEDAGEPPAWSMYYAVASFDDRLLRAM